MHRQASGARYRPSVSIHDWDPLKAAENLRRHGVSFLEAEEAVRDPLRLVVHDLEHSGREPRFRIMGHTAKGVLLVVVTSERGPRPRIISAWRATKRERRVYEQR